MPTEYLRIIPTDPESFPDDEAVEQAKALLHALLPYAESIVAATDETVVFRDPGENLKRILCPNCDANLLRSGAWPKLLARARRSDCRDLRFELPCCQSVMSLNDLWFDAPAGFSQWVLEAKNPGGGLHSDQLAQLQEVLGCALKAVPARGGTKRKPFGKRRG